MPDGQLIGPARVGALVRLLHCLDMAFPHCARGAPVTDRGMWLERRSGLRRRHSRSGPVRLPSVQGVVRGALVLRDPGPINRTFVIVPSGTSGYGLINPGPIQ